MEMTSLGPAVTQGPLGRTSMPCGSKVNGIAAGLLIKHTGDTHYATHFVTHTAAAPPPLRIHTDTPTQKNPYNHHH